MSASYARLVDRGGNSHRPGEVVRYWVRFDGSYSLDAYGWLDDPGDPGSSTSYQDPDAVTSDALESIACAVLLGEPGMGKSYALSELAEKAKSSGSQMLHIDLESFGSEDRLVREVLNGPEIRSWIENDHDLWLFLDSLDEARSLIPTLPALLSKFVRDCPASRLRLRLACRTSDWPASLGESLTSVFEDAGVHELLPLRRSDAASLLTDGTNQEEFLQAVEESNAGPLAARPLTLRMLNRIYALHGQLPDQVAELYEIGLAALVDESNQRRRDRRGIVPSPSDILLTASWMAALSSLSAKPTFWRGPAIDADGHDLVESEWRLMPPRAAVADPAEDAFRTGLFSGRGPNRLGWAHSTFAEFLAARWMNSAQLTSDQVSQLLCADDGALYPQVAQIGVWLVAINPHQYGWLVRVDPAAFVSKVDLPDPVLRKETVRMILERARAGQMFHSWERDYHGLAHAELDAQLIEALADPIEEVRQIAIDIARATRTVQAFDRLETLALNEAESYRLRVSACMAIHSMNDLRKTDQLIPLISRPQNAGETGELEGAALYASWPHALNTAEALAHVSIRWPRNLFGIYSMFVGALADALTDTDLEAAIAWYDQLGESKHDERLAPLVEATVRLALANLNKPPVVRWVAQVAAERIRRSEPIVGTHARPVALAETDRRILAIALLSDSQFDHVIQVASPFAGPGTALLNTSDLSWLVDQYEKATGKLREKLANAIQLIYMPDDLGHIETVLAVDPTHPIRTDVLKMWFDPIELDSEQARQLRAQREQVKQWERSRPSLDEIDDTWINPKIDELLQLASRGDTSAYVQASRLVTVPPRSDRYFDSFESDLTSMPRWKTLEPATHALFLEESSRFLKTAHCNPSSWLGQQHVPYEAVAAFRAVVLLMLCAPELLDRLEPEVWQEWAPIIVEWPKRDYQTDNTVNNDLFSRALASARVQLEEMLIRALQAATDSYPAKDLELRLLWGPSLVEGLLGALDRLAPLSESAVLNAFAALEPTAVRAALLRRLEPNAIAEDRPRAVRAAAQLLQYDAPGSWSELSELMENDPALFHDACMLRCEGADESVPDLNEAALGQLFVWLEREFPRAEDPLFDGMHGVGARETLGDWRDAILTALTLRGTPASVKAVARIAEAFPEYEWLRRSLVRAKEALVVREWVPVTAKHLVDFVEDNEARFVRSERELLDAAVAALGSIQKRLQGDTPDAPLLWDTVSRRPKSEDEISDYLRSRMNDYFGRRGIIVNREVQVRRIRPSGIGERTDLRIDATTNGSQPLAMAGEVKGCWNSDVETALQTQLVDRYMADLHSGFGLYIVVWFDVDNWDTGDPRRRQAGTRTPRAFNEHLQPVIDRLAETGRHVRVFHLDASLSRPTQA